MLVSGASARVRSSYGNPIISPKRVTTISAIPLTLAAVVSSTYIRVYSVYAASKSSSLSRCKWESRVAYIAAVGTRPSVSSAMIAALAATCPSRAIRAATSSSPSSAIASSGPVGESAAAGEALGDSAPLPPSPRAALRSRARARYGWPSSRSRIAATHAAPSSALAASQHSTRPAPSESSSAMTIGHRPGSEGTRKPVFTFAAGS